MAIEDAKVIDLVAHDPGGTVVLVMVEGRGWDGSDQRLFELQEKINSYVSFALDGQLTELYPELAGKPVRLELRCAAQPDSKTAAFLDLARSRLQEEGLLFHVQEFKRVLSG